MEGTYLAAVDADRIQDYIFAPRQLKLIRGASAIQRDVNLKHAMKLLRGGAYGVGNLSEQYDAEEDHASHEWEVVYAGGGNIYALFRDTGKAHDFAVQTERLYRQYGGSATATTAVVRWRESFRETLKDAQEELVLRKSSASIPRDAAGSPYWKICEACGLDAASEWGKSSVTGERILCAGCEKRRDNSESSQLLKEVRSDLKAPADFAAIGGLARPENYLGFVYLDVDKLGRFFDKLEPFDTSNYRKKSRGIRDAVQAAVVEACRAAAADVAEGGTAPFEILMLGGDDAIVMLAAQKVFPFLEKFRQEFEAQCGARDCAELHFSAGVVWAHSHLPIAQFAELGKQLLRSAKRSGGGRVDYLIASESMLRGPGERKQPTCRPYTLKDFEEQLCTPIREWKGAGFPANKVHRLYAMAFEGEQQATLDFLHWLSRLEREHQRLALQLFGGAQFWRETPEGLTTVAADLAEMWSFVESE